MTIYVEMLLVCITMKVCLEQFFHVLKVVVAVVALGTGRLPPSSHRGVGETRVEENREKRLGVNIEEWAAIWGFHGLRLFSGRTSNF